MLDQYFGVKELYEVVLRAKMPMQFGSRYLEKDEPVLYFENISLSVLTENSKPIMARGGWSNLPRVIWEDRSEVQFTLSEGVMSSISMGILLSASVTNRASSESLLVSKREGPFILNDDHRLFLQEWPVSLEQKKTFIFEYERDVAQRKVYGKRIYGITDPLDESKEKPCIEVYSDKELTQLADINKEYIVDYYYEYRDEALVYTIQKERFNGLFTLEGKFYSKDENDGLNYTNLIYMPKVRVMSDINLRLGERTDPSTSVFNIIGIPDSQIGNKNGLILEITRLSDDIDVDNT
jgi:hypothetical protein